MSDRCERCPSSPIFSWKTSIVGGEGPSGAEVQGRQVFQAESSTNIDDVRVTTHIDKGKKIIEEVCLDLNKPPVETSMQQGKATNVYVISDTDTEDSVAKTNTEDEGYENLFGRPDDNLRRWLLGLYAAQDPNTNNTTTNTTQPPAQNANTSNATTNTTSHNQAVADEADQVVPLFSPPCKNLPTSTVPGRNKSVRLFRTVVRTNNPGDTGFKYIMTGGTKFKVLYQLVASRYNYNASDICIHYLYGKVCANWTADQVNLVNNSTLIIHGTRPLMNLDSHYLVFNMTNVGNDISTQRFTVLAKLTVDEFYHPWALHMGRGVSFFHLACHGYYLPSNGSLVESVLRNEDKVFTVLYKEKQINE